MYHWFLLLRLPRVASAEGHRGAALKFFDHGNELTASLSSAERHKLLWLGAVEFIPLVFGSIGASYVEPGAVRGSVIAAGFVLCGVICWLLRHQTPPTRIYSSEGDAKIDQTR